MADHGSLQQSSESAEAVISKLSEKLADLQEEMLDKNIRIGPVQESLLTNMLRTLNKLAPHEQISSLETAVLRMQRLLARNVPSQPAQVASKRKEVASKRKDESEADSELSNEPDEERQPESGRMYKRRRLLELRREADVNFRHSDPAIRARVEDFIRFAVQYKKKMHEYAQSKVDSKPDD